MAEPLEVAMLVQGSTLVTPEVGSQFLTLAAQQCQPLRVEAIFRVSVDSTSTALLDLEFQLDVSDVNLQRCFGITMYASALAARAVAYACSGLQRFWPPHFFFDCEPLSF